VQKSVHVKAREGFVGFLTLLGFTTQLEHSAKMYHTMAPGPAPDKRMRKNWPGNKKQG
jgi:hypothetical protein